MEPANFWMIAFFLLLTVVFWWGHLSGSVFLWEDFTEAYYPFQTFAARSFASGVIPFWNPFTFNGTPFLADLQNGVFYPGNQLMYLLSGGNLGVWLAQFMIIAHYLVALLGMWRLGRALGISQWGSAFAAVAYALSGFMVAHAIHHSLVYHQAWFPVIVLLFYKSVRLRSWFYAFLTGVTLGIALLSGHPQLALYIIFFLLCLTVFLLVSDLRSDDRARSSTVLKAALCAALPVAIGVGIFAIQLLPAMEFAGLSERAEMPYEKSLEGALGPGQLLTLVVPKLFGTASPTTPQEEMFWYRPGTYNYWETAIYIGVATLLLGIVGLASRRLGGFGWFLAAMGLFGLLYGLGDSFFIHPIFGKLPGFNLFRIPTRLAIYMALGGSLLAGVGLDRILRRDGDNELLGKVVLAAGGAIVLIGVLSVSGVILSFLNVPAELPPDTARATAATGIVAILVGGIATAIAWMRLRGKMPATGAAIAMLLLGVVDMCLFGMGQNSSPDNPQAGMYQRIDEQYAAFKASPPEKLFRVKMREGGAMLMPRNQGLYSGIMLYDGYNALVLQRRVPPTATPDLAYDLLNIRYDVKLNGGQSAELVERPHPLAHVRMLYDARVTAESAASRAMLKTVDPATTVVLEEDPGVKLDGTGAGTATVKSYSASEIETQVTTDKPGVMVMSEIWYPAWHVYIDGAPAKLLIADYSLRAVAVPAGTHTVTMRFESGAFRTGTWITIIALVAGIAGLVFTWMKRKSSGAEEVPASTPAPVA